MFPNFLGFILLVCHKAHLDWPKTVEKPVVAICFVKNRKIPVLLLLFITITNNHYFDMVNVCLNTPNLGTL